MPFSTTPIQDLIVYEPTVWDDPRGYFFESYNKQTFSGQGITAEFVQDNEARSTFGILRGLHYQTGPYAQAKLVRVVEGEVLDVAVDIRPESQTYGQWYSIRLSAENKRQLYVPRGFAHGYVVLSPTAVFCYKCDNFYSRDHEGGIRFDDPTLGIDWQIEHADVLLSEKDTLQPAFGNHIPFS
ncbi:MAG: dTDP-4-dehydrorhamnose 3,5-epimerase [Saprospiraceae bacterium]|jgi:dTDP-4-dehydrorhamnose 3,5-epimerase